MRVSMKGAESIKVLYGYFSSQKEAYEKMKFINKTTDFKEAWVDRNWKVR